MVNYYAFLMHLNYSQEYDRWVYKAKNSFGINYEIWKTKIFMWRIKQVSHFAGLKKNYFLWSIQLQNIQMLSKNNLQLKG